MAQSYSVQNYPVQWVSICWSGCMRPNIRIALRWTMEFVKWLTVGYNPLYCHYNPFTMQGNTGTAAFCPWNSRFSWLMFIFDTCLSCSDHCLWFIIPSFRSSCNVNPPQSVLFHIHFQTSMPLTLPIILKPHVTDNPIFLHVLFSYYMLGNSDWSFLDPRFFREYGYNHPKRSLLTTG